MYHHSIKVKHECQVLHISPIPCCSHENTHHIPATTGMELTFRPWPPFEFHCTCAEATWPMGCSQPMTKCDRNMKAGLFLGGSRQLWCELWPKNSKGLTKASLASHTSTQPSIPPSCIQGQVCMVAWQLSHVFSASPPFFSVLFPPNQILAHLLLTWNLLPEEPRLPHSPQLN